MRQRITFLQDPQDSVDPKLLKVTGTSISAENLKAAREDRLTFSFDELPQELYRALKASHELHLRWICPNNYDAISPLVSRLSPGLHVSYTPQGSNSDSSLLCPLLKKVFGDLDCQSPEESFTVLPAGDFFPTTTAQYYQPLESLHDFVEYSKHKLCQSSREECFARVSSILHASSIDIDFDTISHALTVKAFWPTQVQDLNLEHINPNDRLEVGVLSVELARVLGEISLGGFLTIVGQDTKPSPTLFSFAARHHPTESSFSTSFLTPTGLHPTLQLKIGSSAPPTEERSCSLHAHFTFPRAIFADRYQLSDPLFLASKNISTLRHITTPVDLEAPAYTMSLWGSSALIELAPPLSRADQPWTVEVPLHLRYLPPASSTSGQSQVEIPYPVVFWACAADEESHFSNNPFDRVNIGYDALYSPQTMFYHLSPEGDRLINAVSVPVLDLDKSWYIERGTAAMVLLGFLWVLWSLRNVLKRQGYGSGTHTTARGKKGK